MNRERTAVWAFAAIAAASAAAPAVGKDAPKPSFSVAPISAPNLLAPVEEDRGELTTYRLDPGLDAAAGQRARLSLDVGDATVFAITGRLNRQPSATGPLPSADARLIGQRRDSGKIYGAGVTHQVRGVELSGTYQYSKVTAQPQSDREQWDDGPGKSHSLKATARIRFKP